MNRICNAISQLLYEHDKVIVPGLGAFLRRDEGAQVNIVTNTFVKPSSVLVFDQGSPPYGGVREGLYGLIRCMI